MLNELSSIRLPADGVAPITLIHQFLRGTTSLSLEECIQAEPQHINTVDELGLAPLHWAASRADLGAVRTLLGAGADVNQLTSHTRESPLLLACTDLLNHNKMTELIELLLHSGASQRPSGFRLMTPLHCVAARAPYLRDEACLLARFLLDHGADSRARDDFNREPLHCLGYVHPDAAYSTIKRLAMLLLDRGAHMESRDTGGATPLLDACERGIISTAHALLELGADNLATRHGGFNCLQLLCLAPPLQDPSSLPPELLIGVNPDAEAAYGLTTLGYLLMRLQNPSIWCSVPMRWLTGMVALIVATREANWEAGLFLESRTSLRADGQHAYLVEQLAGLRQRIERDPSFGDLKYSEVDVNDRYIGVEDEDETDDDEASSRSELEDEEDDKQDLARSEDDEGDVFHDALESQGR